MTVTETPLQIARVRTWNAMERKAEVLIVEDSEEVLWMIGNVLENAGFTVDAVTTIGNVLENAGFTVDAVTTGEGALEKMRKFPETKLIIINYLLPDMSGLAVLGRLRENGSQVKVIAVSALKEVRESLVNVGAFSFLEKPFDIKEFIGVCKQAVNGNNAEPGIASEI